MTINCPTCKSPIDTQYTYPARCTVCSLPTQVVSCRSCGREICVECLKAYERGEGPKFEKGPSEEEMAI